MYTATYVPKEICTVYTYICNVMEFVKKGLTLQWCNSTCHDSEILKKDCSIIQRNVRVQVQILMLKHFKVMPRKSFKIGP